MSWINFFDKIFVINLLKRDDRLLQIKWEMDKYEIPFEVFVATEDQDGRIGLMLTLKSLCAKCFMEGMKNIIVFEDDARFILNPNIYMPQAIEQLPDDYDMLYLGVNLTKSYIPKFHSHNLVKVEKGLSLHACAYSDVGMRKVLSIPGIIPFDTTISQTIHPEGKSYAVCPMLATQRPGYSDIEKRQQDWAYALEDRFYERVSLSPNFKTPF